MTDLPKSVRALLERDWRIFSSRIVRNSLDADRTRKLLLEVETGDLVECVLLSSGARRTICLSTQVGCGMGCVFCASGIGGLVRNLTSGEMREQFLQIQALLPSSERLTHVVVMGMGEPLANLEALLEVLAWATSRGGLGISARHVTISTVGLPAKIRALARSGKPYHLAVSLHAPNDELRRQIVPMAEKVMLAELLEAADEFRAVTGRQVTFEYVLLGGVNDRAACARELADLLAGRDAMINLIPYNQVEGFPFNSPRAEDVRRFADELKGRGYIVKVRRRRGDKIAAACGQLRRDELVSLGGSQ